MRKVSRRYFRPKKEPNSCQHCGKETNDLYIYVDESNIAITQNSPYLCKECYKQKYGDR